MREQLKRVARAVAPMPALAMWGKVVGAAKIRRAREAFEQAGPSDRYLPADRLPGLMREGFAPPPPIRYDEQGLLLRADEKIGQLAGRVPLASGQTVVELGCWDGMVLARLAGRGVVSIGADLSTAGLDPRAVAGGVRFVQSDASSLGIAAASVDVVYSFAAFEHFADPDGVVSEAWRVLKPGGYLFLLFGPVYTSPYGLHAYRQIPIPYCQYLFADADLRAFAHDAGLPVAWPFVNGVTVTAYRALWAAHASRFDTVYYHEHPTGGVGAELIARFPECFRGRVPAFDDLIVSAVEICLRRR